YRALAGPGLRRHGGGRDTVVARPDAGRPDGVHSFDSLLPRWPTFGLNLQAYPPGGVGGDVWIPPQDTTATTEPWTAVDSATALGGAILDTFLDWRDTVQSALPGSRGRTAHVRQHPGEGGMNLFMTADAIRRLALRGRKLARRCATGSPPTTTAAARTRRRPIGTVGSAC